MKQASADRITKPARQLGPGDQGKRMTLEEFFAADGEEGYWYELIRGRLVVMPSPGRPHERLLDWLRERLKGYAAQHPEVINDVSGPARLILADPAEEVSAPQPDLACYRDYPTDTPEDRWWP